MEWLNDACQLHLALIKMFGNLKFLSAELNWNPRNNCLNDIISETNPPEDVVLTSFVKKMICKTFLISKDARYYDVFTYVLFWKGIYTMDINIFMNINIL